MDALFPMCRSKFKLFRQMFWTRFGAMVSAQMISFLWHLDLKPYWGPVYGHYVCRQKINPTWQVSQHDIGGNVLDEPTVKRMKNNPLAKFQVRDTPMKIQNNPSKKVQRDARTDASLASRRTLKSASPCQGGSLSGASKHSNKRSVRTISLRTQINTSIWTVKQVPFKCMKT